MPRLASRRLIVFAVVTLVLGFPTFARAQKNAGSMVGTVKDATGAPVSNAKVTVTAVERGSTFSATTNDAGEYVVGPLRVGRYIVMVEHPGFKKAVLRLWRTCFGRLRECSSEQRAGPGLSDLGLLAVQEFSDF